MRNGRNGILLTVCALAGMAQAQDVNPTLAKARVIEEGEHDAATAAELYASVMNDAKASGAVRTDAALRLAGALRSLGRAEEARAMLERAAAGEGPAAALAQTRLAAWQNPQKSDGSIDLEVLRLMTQLRAPVSESVSGDVSAILAQLTWYGERAVPLLVQAVSAESDFRFVSNCSRALLMIGGAAVDAWIDAATRFDEPLRRRAVARAGSSGTERQKRKLAAFLGDLAAEVRLQAVESGVLVDLAQAAAMAGDEDGRVRDAAARWIGNTSNWTLEDIDQDRRREVFERLIAAIPLALEPTHLAGAVGVAIYKIESDEDACWLLTRLLGAGVELEGTTKELLLARLNQPATGTNLLVDNVLGLARSLPPTAAVTSVPKRTELFRKLCQSVVWTWDRQQLPAALELIERGYGFDVEWFGSRATPEDWVRIYEKLAAFETVPGYSASFLSRQLDASVDLELPDAAFEPLRRWFVARLEDRVPLQAWHATALRRLARFGSRDSLQWTHDALTKGGAAVPGIERFGSEERRDSLLQGLIAGAPERGLPVLRRLAVAEGAEHAELRNLALSRLVWLHDVESAGMFVTAYRLGLGRTTLLATPSERRAGGTGVFDIQLSGLQFLELGLPQEWTAAERALAVEPCLEAGIAAAFHDTVAILPKRSETEYWRSPVLSAILRWNARCSDDQFRLSIFRELFKVPDEPEVAMRIVSAGLADQFTDIRLGALQRIAQSRSPIPWSSELETLVKARLVDEEPRIVAEAIDVLAQRSAEAVESWVTPFVTADHDLVRAAAIRRLFRQAPERAFDLTVDAWRSPTTRRLLLCEVASQSLDRRFVPYLIDLLRDGNDSTRKAAREALDAIEFYLSQEQRWQRLLDDAGLESTNAAEALLTQARTATDLRIRLAAIHSLGTLAVPETLPFLIQLMQDAKPEVAAAAGAAVERINQPKRD